MGALPAGEPPFLVVTPYFRESRATIERCIASVAAQTVPTRHLLVADGHAQDWLTGTDVRHIALDRSHGNFGNTPRAIGLMAGIGGGYQGLGLLDADNWLDPDHVATCLAAARALPDCDYVIAQRRFRRLDGSEMPLVEEPVANHVDTSCFFFLPGSFGAVPIWGTMYDEIAPICDRIFYAAVRQQGLRAAHSGKVTVNFEVTIDHCYRSLGETPPPGAKPGVDLRRLADWITRMDARERLVSARRCGTTLSVVAPDPGNGAV